ncbi:hypothetical protein Pcinc_026094 [Petrolisthes cinctipes]|uniref:Uncharacterized protein n=1 Tax=Petrolisthes cinctipes TaxID=88211 RepID=A0AAE1F7Z6_PETCI|nr:hypothetical protein Pcinc_026094 [Petrolisthes cinctipes]
MSSLTVSPSPSFLAKNEQSDDLLRPLKIPSFDPSGNPHHLCLVNTTKAYIDATPDVSWDHLFFNPLSGRPLVVRGCVENTMQDNLLSGPRPRTLHSRTGGIPHLPPHTLHRGGAGVGRLDFH